MNLVWCPRNTYRDGRPLPPAAGSEISFVACGWRVRRVPPAAPRGGEAQELDAAVVRALDESIPGDLVYLPELATLHAPDASDALVEGLTQTDADYLTLIDAADDYWPADDHPAPAGDTGDAVMLAAVALSAWHTWSRRAALGRSFACRRGLLERDHDVLVRCTDEDTGEIRWPALWQGLRRRGRVLRAVVPAAATSCAPAEASPSYRGRRPEPTTAPTPAASDFWQLARPPERIAVLPSVSAMFCAELSRLCPASRLVTVPSADTVVAHRHTCVAVTVTDKEAVDDVLRFRRHIVTAVLVELSDTDPTRTVRWVPGRDWLLPAAAASALPWVV